jgi:hypothetical protein
MRRAAVSVADPDRPLPGCWRQNPHAERHFRWIADALLWEDRLRLSVSARNAAARRTPSADEVCCSVWDKPKPNGTTERRAEPMQENKWNKMKQKTGQWGRERGSCASAADASNHIPAQLAGQCPGMRCRAVVNTKAAYRGCIKTRHVHVPEMTIAPSQSVAHSGMLHWPGSEGRVHPARDRGRQLITPCNDGDPMHGSRRRSHERRHERMRPAEPQGRAPPRSQLGRSALRTR